MKKRTAAIILNCLFFFTGIAQYTVNGSATQDNCHCYTLTTNTLTQSGSVWNNNRIDLNQSFTFSFNVFLGCNDGGADGISFVLQPISTSVGGNGSGMGYGGITPGVGVTLDTYQNSLPDNDPFYDHIAIQLNGDVNHSSPNTITPPTAISATNNNVEDCAWHLLKVMWDATTKSLSVYFDNQLRVSATNDLVNTIFGGNSMVFWGFTGATGGLSNLQQFCTSLTPNFHLLPNQKRCIGEPITFYDSTVTFGGILKRYWNFGDGSPLDSVNANPVHTYTTAGSFTVTLTVIAIDSCIENFSQTITIGSKPVAGFSISDSCVSNTIQFTDTSTASVGTINNWYWELDNGSIPSTQQNPAATYSIYGIKTIKFVVTSLEGCSSDTLIRPIRIYARPVADFTFTDSLCLGTANIFTDNSTLADGPVVHWMWYVDGTSILQDIPSISYTFLTPGMHTVGLTTTGINNATCFSLLTQKNIFVVDKPVAAVKAISGCQSQQIQLLDSSYTTDGFAITQWWWDLGNGQFSALQNPLVTYLTPGIKLIKLVVTNSRGCISDTLTQSITVFEKPIADFGFDADVCTGTPVQFLDSSHINSSTITGWSWIQSGTEWSTLQNPPKHFPAGPQTVGLVVISADGCKSDTTYKSFLINPKPVISFAFNDECKNTPVPFAAAITTGILNEWHWSFGDGSLSNIMSPNHTYTSNGNYGISLYAIDQFGCSTDTLTGNINIYGTNAFAGNDTIAAAGQPVQLNASGGLSYEWNPSTGLTDPSISNPVATINATQTYQLKAFTPEGCESYDSITIKIYDGPDIYLPNAFTPNDDGINDILLGIPVGIKEFHYLKIYNRWGQQIFYSADYRRGWDGRFKGEKQERGVYVFLVSGTAFTGKIINKKGTILLIR